MKSQTTLLSIKEKEEKLEIFRNAIEELSNTLYLENTKRINTYLCVSNLNENDNIFYKLNSDECPPDNEKENFTTTNKQFYNEKSFAGLNLDLKIKASKNLFKKKLLIDDHKRPKPIKTMLQELKQGR